MRVSGTAIIADDHAMIRTGLRDILTTAGLQVVAEAADGLQAVATVRAHRPTLLTLDIAMPYARGIEVFEEVRRWSPETRVAVFSGMTSVGLLSSLRDAGAHGLFLKRDDPSALADALPGILSGQQIISPEAADVLEKTEMTTALTARERQVLSLVARGFTNREVAERLGVSAKTVDNHRTNLMRKIGSHSLAGLLSYALREGLLDADRQD